MNRSLQSQCLRLLFPSIIAIAAGCDGAITSADKPAAAPPATPVEVAQVSVGEVVVDITAVGSLNADESVVIRSEIPGRIREIHFAEGDRASLGSPLVTLDDSEYRAQVEEDRAAMELARLNFQRATDLHHKKLASEQNFDEARARLEQARARLALDEARLAKTRIVAPFEGLTGLREVSPGDYIQAGQNIVNFEDIDPIKVEFRVPERYLNQVHEEQAVEVRVDSFPDQAFKGEVYAIDPRIDRSTRTVVLKARVANADGRLHPGMFARVRLVFEKRDNALLVPEQAIVPQGDGKFLYVIVDGKAQLRPVKIGKRVRAQAEILDGVTAQDTIVVTGHQKIRPGGAVRAVNQPGSAQADERPAGG